MSLLGFFLTPGKMWLSLSTAFQLIQHCLAHKPSVYNHTLENIRRQALSCSLAPCPQFNLGLSLLMVVGHFPVLQSPQYQVTVSSCCHSSGQEGFIPRTSQLRPDLEIFTYLVHVDMCGHVHIKYTCV